MPRGQSRPMDFTKLDRIKQLSGRAIEDRRKRLRMTQPDLARSAGLGERWVREIEGGSPSASIDDHFKCAFAAGLPASYLFVLILCMDYRLQIPSLLVMDDLEGIERLCVETIGEFVMSRLARDLRRVEDTGA